MKPDFLANTYIICEAFSRTYWESVFVACTLSIIEKRELTTLECSNLYILLTKVDTIPKSAISPSSLS